MSTRQDPQAAAPGKHFQQQSLKILAVTSGQRGRSTFEKSDYYILRELGEVRCVHWTHFVKLRREMKWCDIIFRWFCDLPAWVACRMARRLKKRFYVVAGGFDVESLPEIGYGLGQESLMDRWIVTRMRNTVLKRADAVLAVSQHTLDNAKALGASNPFLIYNAVDLSRFHFNENAPRRKRIVTQAWLNKLNYRAKGLSTFVCAAGAVQSKFPDVEMVVLGRDLGGQKVLEQLAKEVHAQVEFRVIEDREAYRKYLAESSVYVQASAVESFGLSLAEAMACGCYPVVTNRGALPEVAGLLSKSFEFDDVAALSEILCSLLECPISREDSKSIRAHIADHFSLKKRRTALTELIGGHVKEEREKK